MLHKIIFFIFLFFSSSGLFSNPTDQILQTGTPIEVKTMRDHLSAYSIPAVYSGEVYFVKFSEEINGVFKVVNNDRDPHECNAEEVAYRISLELGLDFVPKAFIREVLVGDVIKKGCIKEYKNLETQVNINEKPELLALLKSERVDKAQLNEVRCFLFLIGNYDCSIYNIIALKEGEVIKIYVVDNGDISKKVDFLLGSNPFIKEKYVEGFQDSDTLFEWNDDIRDFVKAKNKEDVSNRLINRVERYFRKHNGKPYRFKVNGNRVWRQIPGDLPKFFLSDIVSCSKKIKEKLEYWLQHPEELDRIFQNTPFYDEEYKMLLFNRIRILSSLPHFE